MTGALAHADSVLRGRLFAAGGLAISKRRLAAAVLAAGLFYGAVMGTFGGFAGERLLQIAYSSIKVPLLLLAAFAIALPSFFVLNTLLGLRSDFGEALRGLLAAQAGLTIILASFAPYTALWYVSFDDYRGAILFNAVAFGIASLASQRLLRRFYQPLIARQPRHRLMMRTWLVLYAFVGIQMGWTLRPFIGSPGMPVQFFREDTWGNAYVIVGEMIWDAMRR